MNSLSLTIARTHTDNIDSDAPGIVRMMMMLMTIMMMMMAKPFACRGE